MDIKLSPHASAIIAIEIVGGADDDHDPPCFATLREVVRQDSRGAYTIRGLTKDTAEHVYEALTELANSQDFVASNRGFSPTEREAARHARSGLTNAASKAIQAVFP